MTWPAGVLPSAFSGDEHVCIAGVAQALLPPTLPHLQQQHQWVASDWGQLVGNTIPAPLSNEWQGFWTPSLDKGVSFSPQIEADACQPGCTMHSEAHHSAALLVGKLIAFPTNYVQQWLLEKTDGVLVWLNRQTTLEASPLGSASGSIPLPLQPTRQDAELLRICKHEPPAQAIGLTLTGAKSSISFPGSKRPSMAKWT